MTLYHHSMASKRQILIEIDGPHTEPTEIDTRSALAFFAAYVDLLSVVSEHEKMDLQIRGLDIVNKCTAVQISVANVSAALSMARRSSAWVKDPATAPRGLGQPALRAHKARLALRGGTSAAVRSATSDRGLVKIEAIEAKPSKFSERTEVRATVVRCGGDESAVVEMRVEPEGRIVKFDVGRDVAVEMGKRLYDQVDADVTLERDEDFVPIRGCIHDYDWVDSGLSADEQIDRFMGWLTGPGYDA